MDNTAKYEYWLLANDILLKVVSALCDIIPEGTILMITPGRIALLDSQNLNGPHGTIKTASEIASQSSDDARKGFIDSIKEAAKIES